MKEEIKTFCAGDCDVDSGTIEDEFQPARGVFAVTGTEQQNTDGRFLPLNLSNAADSRDVCKAVSGRKPVCSVEQLNKKNIRANNLPRLNSARNEAFIVR